MPQTRMNSLKSLAMNCGPLSEMIRGVTPGKSFPAPLDDLLDLLLLHGFPDFPVDDGAAAAIQDTAQVVERACEVEVRDVHVPVLMHPQGCSKPVPFLVGLAW